MSVPITLFRLGNLWTHKKKGNYRINTCWIDAYLRTRLTLVWNMLTKCWLTETLRIIENYSTTKTVIGLVYDLNLPCKHGRYAFFYATFIFIVVGIIVAAHFSSLYKQKAEILCSRSNSFCLLLPSMWMSIIYIYIYTCKLLIERKH